jgi:hypothetical protein
MTKLKRHSDEDGGDSLLFPGVKRRPVREAPNDEAPPADAVRMVEDAMRDAQFKFDRLRRMLGYDIDGDDRPRAA